MFGPPTADSASEANIIGFVKPKAGQLLASSFIGQPVYEIDSNDAKSIGKLNDLIEVQKGRLKPP